MGVRDRPKAVYSCFCSTHIFSCCCCCFDLLSLFCFVISCFFFFPFSPLCFGALSMWHVATADAATVAPANALHSSQDIRYISRFHTGNPIGTWLCSISKLTILNFSFVFLFLFLFSRILWTLQICLLTSKKKYCMFVKYFIKFSYVFLSFLFFFYFLFGKLEKNSTHVVSFGFWLFSWEMFCGKWTRRRSSFVCWSLDFLILGRVRAESPRTRNARHELTKRNASSRWGCRCGYS